MIAEYMLTFITDRGLFSGKTFADFSIGEGINTDKMGIDECSRVLFQK